MIVLGTGLANWVEIVTVITDLEVQIALLHSVLETVPLGTMDMTQGHRVIV